MIKKKIIFVSIIFFLANCGFTPIYLQNKNVNFSIEQVSYAGDRELNNFLKTKLNQYKNNKISNKIYIEANSVYEKSILTKNASGEATSYNIEVEIIFLIKPSNKEIIISEKKIMDSMSDKFEESQYERSIKENFASSISNKLTNKLIIN
jgi:hypothetical protein